LRYRTRRLGLSGLIAVAALSASLLVPATMFAADTTTTTCDEGHWPRSVQGLPTMLKAGARAGDYIWHDSRGWHLRVTHPGTTKVGFSGRIVSTTPITFTPYRLEPGDTATLSADKLTLTYRFANYGHLDGVDFKTACARKLVFSGAMAGVRLPVGRIWIGYNGVHPLQNPFAVWRIS